MAKKKVESCCHGEPLKPTAKEKAAAKRAEDKRRKILKERAKLEKEGKQTAKASRERMKKALRKKNKKRD